MICKKCKKAFRKDVADMEGPDEADEYCPHCDNHFLREAVTKEAIVGLGGSGSEDPRKDARCFSHSSVADERMEQDSRVQGARIQSKLEALVDASGRLG
jgi:hypothetical protein